MPPFGAEIHFISSDYEDQGRKKRTDELHECSQGGVWHAGEVGATTLDPPFLEQGGKPKSIESCSYS